MVKNLKNLWLILKNLKAARSTIRNITNDEKSLTCHKRINQELFDFFKNLFSENLVCLRMEICNF